MGKRSIFAKVLAIAATALLWLVLLAPVVLAVVETIQLRGFRFDYLAYAELFPFVLAAGGLLIWSALLARSRRGLLIGSLAAAVVLLVGSQVLAMVTGLASGATETGGWDYRLVLALIIGYSLSIVVTGVGGVLLVADLFRAPRSIGPGAEAAPSLDAPPGPSV